MGKYILLKPNFTFELIEEPKKNESNLDFWYKHIECDCIDIVDTIGLDTYVKKLGFDDLVKKYCLIADDIGLLKENYQLNGWASLLYGALNHGQWLAGNIMVGKNLYTDDGIETVGLDEEDIGIIISCVNDLVDLVGKD